MSDPRVQTARAPRLAVLIDADNVPSSYAEAIFEEIASLGEASVRRIYGDWSAQRLAGWAKKVAALGLVAATVPDRAPATRFSSTVRSP